MRPDYHRATRNAYRTLLAARIDRLPVDVEEICTRCRDTALVSFRAARDIMGWDFDPFFDGPSQYAMVSRVWTDGRPYHTIVWNDELLDRGSGRWRFAIAHELAHVVLRHPGGLDPSSELEADLFAQHLLCPRPVLEVLQPADARQVARLCGVSPGMARLAFSQLNQENRYVDRDVWNGIFAAFDLDERRSVSDYLTAVGGRLLTRSRSQCQ